MTNPALDAERLTYGTERLLELLGQGTEEHHEATNEQSCAARIIRHRAFPIEDKGTSSVGR